MTRWETYESIRLFLKIKIEGYLSMSNILFCVNNEVFASAQQIADNVIDHLSLPKWMRNSLKQRILAFRRNSLMEGKHFNFLLPSDLPRNGKILYGDESDVVRLGNTGVNAFTILGIREILRNFFKFSASKINDFIAKYYSKPISKKEINRMGNTHAFNYLFLNEQKKQFFVFFKVDNLLNRLKVSLLHSINNKLDLLISHA